MIKIIPKVSRNKIIGAFILLILAIIGAAKIGEIVNNNFTENIVIILLLAFGLHVYFVMKHLDITINKRKHRR